MQNVILIQTDQQRYDSLGCNGNPHAVTPNLDALAGAGCNFRRHWTGNAVCMPSRACLMTGRHVGGHGVWMNGVSLPRSKQGHDHSPVSCHWDTHCRNIESHVPTMADAFAAAGYHTASVGKLHLQPYRHADSLESEQRWAGEKQLRDWHGPYYGFEHVELVVGHGAVVGGHHRHWIAEHFPHLQDYSQHVRRVERPIAEVGDLFAAPVPAEAHASSYIAGQAAGYLQDRARQPEPFFLYVSFPDPHHPFSPPEELAREFETHGTLAPADPEGERAGEVSVFKAMRASRPQKAPAGDGVRLIRQYTDAQMHLIDRAVGQLVDTLKQLGMWENTIVAFTSDHGDWLGDHGLIRKDMVASRSLNHVPMIVRAPGSDLPSQTSRIMSNTDVLPTLCDLAGVAAPVGVQGRSMLPVIRDGLAHAALITHYMPTADLHNFSICDDRYRYTYYPGRNERELYDHQQDPQELVNLAGEASHRGIAAELHLQLLEAHVRADAPGVGRVSQW